MFRSPWATALRMTETAASDGDLYLQHAQQPNAYAAGRRSVAVTSRVLEDYRAGPLSERVEKAGADRPVVMSQGGAWALPRPIPRI